MTNENWKLARSWEEIYKTPNLDDSRREELLDLATGGDDGAVYEIALAHASLIEKVLRKKGAKWNNLDVDTVRASLFDRIVDSVNDYVKKQCPRKKSERYALAPWIWRQLEWGLWKIFRKLKKQSDREITDSTIIENENFQVEPSHETLDPSAALKAMLELPPAERTVVQFLGGIGVVNENGKLVLVVKPRRSTKWVAERMGVTSQRVLQMRRSAQKKSKQVRTKGENNDKPSSR